ncbi:DUF6241 domain-containing protein [Haloimpatiens sp. FM7330]|uniref:DUF6241 domain-containing protein n=1 Tax=Haloimpatiens sp. FM7330 TaxID=3298610 RepID=UPI00362D3A86
MKKKIIIVIIILFICLSGGLYLFGEITGNQNIATKCVEKINTMRFDQKLEKNVKAVENNKKPSVPKLSEMEVVDVMHKMANTKVIADKKWGFVKITKERIKNLKTIVSESNYKEKEKLLEILNKWEEGNFSEADKDHNFLWDKLGGTVGKAKGVLKEEQN